MIVLFILAYTPHCLPIFCILILKRKLGRMWEVYLPSTIWTFFLV